MSVEYLKEASKTPATGEDETRQIVAEMLADIDNGRKARVRHSANTLDGWDNDGVMSARARLSQAEGMAGHALNGDDRPRKCFPDEEFDLRV